MEIQGTQNSQTISKKNTGGLTLPNFQIHYKAIIIKIVQVFPGGTVVKNPLANAGDTGSSPGPGRSHMPQSN